MSRKEVNHDGQLSKCNGKPKLWGELKNELNLQGQLQFIYNQVIHSIPKSWQNALRKCQKYGFPGPWINEKLSKLLFKQTE